MTNIASTSRSGKPARQYPQTFVADILGGIDVAVMVRAAMRAVPRPNVKRLCLGDRTTLGTGLGAREPAVAFDEGFTFARRFVFQKSNQHSEAHIGHGPSELVVLQHSLHMQIFDGDDLVFVYDPSRQLVEVVFSGARHAFMCARNQLPRLVAAVGAFLFAGKRLLFPLQIALRLFKVARVVELGAVTSDGEVRQPNVNSDGFSFRRNGRHSESVVSQDGGVKLAASVAADGDGLDLADDLAVNDALRPADFRQVDFRAVQLHTLRILNRLPAMLRLEARIASALGKEIFEGARKVLKRLLNGLRVRILQPLKLLLELWEPNGHRVIVQSLAGLTVKLLRLGKGFVPHPTRATKLNSQSLRLLFRRIEAYAGRVQHFLDIGSLCLNSKRPPYIPVLKGGVLRRKR